MKASIVRENGFLKIDIDGERFSPLAFKTFRANEQNIKEFHDVGMRLYTVLFGGIISALGVPYSLFGDSWIGDHKYDFTPIDRQMDLFLKIAPDGYFAPMIQLDTRAWFLQAHPDIPNSFTHLSQMAWSQTWREAAADYLQATLKHCEEKYGDRIFGYFLLCGSTTEWLSDRDYEEPHPIKNEAYRAWTHDPNTSLPSLERLNQKGDVFLSPEEEDVYRARVFQNETITDAILYFSAKTQEIIKHDKLLGMYAGYLFELGGERLYHCGACGYERVFTSPDIDMIASPSSYAFRDLLDPSAYMLPQKTLDLHNKLYFLEFDHRTHTARSTVEDEADASTEQNALYFEMGGKISNNKMIVQIPGADKSAKNEAESVNILRRDFLFCHGNRSALWWFDMFDGWFRSPGMMNAIRDMICLEDELSAQKTHSVAQIAVIAEGDAMMRARKSADLATQCLSNVRGPLAACGAAYELFSACDLADALAEQYTMVLFLNAYDIPAKRKELIRRLREKGKTLVWLYAPDYAHGGVCDCAHIRELTGISVSEGREDHGGLVFEGAVTKTSLAPPYFSPDDGEVLARFEDGTPAAAQKGQDIYIASCLPSAALLRAIAQKSGARIFSRQDNVFVYPNSRTVGVYNASDVPANVFLNDDGPYTDLFTGKVFSCVDGVLCLPPDEQRAYLLQKEGE